MVCLLDIPDTLAQREIQITKLVFLTGLVYSTPLFGGRDSEDYTTSVCMQREESAAKHISSPSQDSENSVVHRPMPPCTGTYYFDGDCPQHSDGSVPVPTGKYVSLETAGGGDCGVHVLILFSWDFQLSSKENLLVHFIIEFLPGRRQVSRCIPR